MGIRRQLHALRQALLLGSGYTLFRGGPIRTDMLYQNWSPRRQGMVDAACYLFLFFPAMLFLFWMGGQEAWHAWEIGERSDQSPWRPILYPFKTVIPVTALLRPLPSPAPGWTNPRWAGLSPAASASGTARQAVLVSAPRARSTRLRGTYLRESAQWHR